MNQREIKFRAWDKVLKKWKYTDIQELIFREGSLDEDCQEIICQYTGLKDKGGKEIYERDVVTTAPEAFKKYGDRLDKAEFYEVTYAENIYGWLPFVYHGGNEPALEDCEVIGNVWENPNLLT